MKVLVVEKEKREVARLVRILRLVDPSITIVETIQSLSALRDWMNQNPSPDLVLIKGSKLPSLMPGRGNVVARLILHTKDHSLTYLAFRSHQVAQLPQPPAIPTQKGWTVEEEPLTTLEDTRLEGLFKSRFFVETGQRFLSVPISEIAYFFSDGRFVYFQTHSRNKYIIHYRMEELELLLNPGEFYRINRSYIISIPSIDTIHPYFGSRFKLKLNPSVDDEILVSRNRAPGFRKWLGE